MLHSLRKIIQAVSAAEDLDSALKLVVHHVRRAMRTDVCSIYLHFPQTDNYVLMASEGLNQASIGQACLPSGKGLVGLVGLKSETINLKRAAEHPNFHYVQETGEEAFSSFLGVPIIHHRKVLCNLVVTISCACRSMSMCITTCIIPTVYRWYVYVLIPLVPSCTLMCIRGYVYVLIPLWVRGNG